MTNENKLVESIRNKLLEMEPLSDAREDPRKLPAEIASFIADELAPILTPQGEIAEILRDFQKCYGDHHTGVSQYISIIQAHVLALQSEVEELRKDRKRYEFIKKQLFEHKENEFQTGFKFQLFCYGYGLEGEDFDKRVDAAMEADHDSNTG
jgi:hypothetical protein